MNDLIMFKRIMGRERVIKEFNFVGGHGFYLLRGIK